MNLGTPTKFSKKYKLNVHLIDSNIFLSKLKNISNPEKKENNRNYLLRYLKERQKDLRI